MSITELGIEGEKKARVFLNSKGFQLFQADWLGKKDGKYALFEIKNKEVFTAEYNGKRTAPFDGQGLNLYQVKARLDYQKATGTRCLLLVFEPKSSDVFYQWLDKLEENEHFDTKNNIRIYPLKNFQKSTLELEVTN